MAFDWTSLIGPVLGGIAGSQSGSRQAGTTTVTNQPWAPMQPHLQGIAQQANALYGQNAQMPGYVGDAYSNMMNLGFGATGSPTAQALQQNTLGLLSGAGLGRNQAGNLVYRGGAGTQAPANYGNGNMNGSPLGGVMPSNQNASAQPAAGEWWKTGNANKFGVTEMNVVDDASAVAPSGGQTSWSSMPGGVFGGATIAPQAPDRATNGAMRVNDDGTPMQSAMPAISPNASPAAGGSSWSVSNKSASGLPNANDAYKRLLSGQVDTAAYDPMFDSASRRLSENFNRSVLPGINRNASAAGQYGSSRQGIAQGLAAQGLGNSMADMGANMYGNAYNQAQGNMLGAANAITGANTQLAGAAMSAGGAQAAAAANERLGMARLGEDARQYDLGYGLNAYNAAGNMFNNTLGTQANLGLGTINAANGANNYGWGQLGSLAGIINPMANMGRQESTPYYTNPYAGAIGGAVAGGNLWNMLGG